MRMTVKMEHLLQDGDAPEYVYHVYLVLQMYLICLFSEIAMQKESNVNCAYKLYKAGINISRFESISSVSSAIRAFSQFSSIVKKMLQMSASGQVTSNSSNVTQEWKCRHTHGNKNKAH
jgi:hypothetical protein